MKGPERIDFTVDQIDKVLEAYHEGASPDIIAELAWDGLMTDYRHGFLTYAECENLYYQHFTKTPEAQGKLF